MAKMAILGLLLLSACGRSECQDYTTVFCTKAISCNYPPGSDTTSLTACENAGKKVLEAQRTTEEQCKSGRLRVSAMTCTQFRALIDSTQ